MHRKVLYVHCMVEAAGVGKSRGLCGTVVYHGYREYNYRKPSGLSLTIIIAWLRNTSKAPPVPLYSVWHC